MIYSLNGTLIAGEPGMAVVECGGVGYKCLTTLQTSASLPKTGQQVFLYTYLNLREDAADLFGFFTREELEAFRMLTGVTGVGPKVALSILSELRPDRLMLAVAASDAKALTRCAGVGNKLAQRIVLELKDKVAKGGLGGLAGLPAQGQQAAAVLAESSPASEAVAALVALGYSQTEAAGAIAPLEQSLPVEELVRQGLKALCSR